MESSRSTRQKRAISAALEAEARPLSAPELLAICRADVPTMSLSTVYRAIKRLLDDGEIHAVELPGEPPRYELAQKAAHHHHHFHCDACDRVFDVDGCPKGLDALVPKGFRLRDHSIVLNGTCADCTKPARR
jgi:Fur family ferric uptake transcriptional regulator